jgi:phosphoribosylformylglycinamidine (FGAM) synthase-like amidotransferase family enzyme
MRSFIGVFVVIGIVSMLYFFTKDVEPIKQYPLCIADGEGNVKCEEE